MVVKSVGQPREEGDMWSHVDLVHLLDIVDLENGTAVAGTNLCIADQPQCDNSAMDWVATSRQPRPC